VLGPSALSGDGSLVGLGAGEDRVEDGVLGLLDRGVGVVDRKLGVGLSPFRVVFGVRRLEIGLPLVDVPAGLGKVGVPGFLDVAPVVAGSLAGGLGLGLQLLRLGLR